MSRPSLCNVVAYVSNSQKGDDKYVAWYRGQWRTITKFEPIKEACLDNCSHPKAAWVTFEGLTKKRKMINGTQLFMVFGSERVHRDIALGEFWFQAKGPKLPDVLAGDPWLKRKHGNIQI